MSVVTVTRARLVTGALVCAVLPLLVAATIATQVIAPAAISSMTQVFFGFATTHPVAPADRVTYADARRIVRELGSPDIPIVWAGDGECNNFGHGAALEAIACEETVLGRPVILVTPGLTAERVSEGEQRMDQVVAHEVVHAMQTAADDRWLAQHASDFPGVETDGDAAGVEVTAECGSLLLAHAHGLAEKITQPATYVSTCTPLDDALSRAIVFGQPLSEVQR